MSTVERLTPDQVGILSDDSADIQRFIEHDFRIRSGTCPNGCGLMTESHSGQTCAACGFWCNTSAERGTPQ